MCAQLILRCREGVNRTRSATPRNNIHHDDYTMPSSSAARIRPVSNARPEEEAVRACPCLCLQETCAPPLQSAASASTTRAARAPAPGEWTCARSGGGVNVNIHPALPSQRNSGSLHDGDRPRERRAQTSGTTCSLYQFCSHRSATAYSRFTRFNSGPIFASASASVRSLPFCSSRRAP